MTDQNGTQKVVRELNWSIVIQILTFGFLVGASYFAFETKNEHQKDLIEMRKETAILYMPRELSLEKWRGNDESHARIEKLMAEIRDEIRRSNAAQKGK